MRGFFPMRGMLLCGLLGGVVAAGTAQVYTPPPPPLTTLPPCPVDKDTKKRAKRTDCDPTVYPSETINPKAKKSAEATSEAAPPASGTAAEKFPFPGDQPAASTPAAQRFPYPGAGSAPDAAQDPAAAAKAASTPASKAFPFPGGTTPDLPADSSEVPPKPDSSSSSSSSSGDASSSSSDEDRPVAADKRAPASAAKNPDDDDEDQPKLKDKGSGGRRALKVVRSQSDTDRVDEDLSIAKFYGQSGNYMGAYLRAKDAVKTQPDYPEAHFALGEAAKRLKKKEEAVAEFQAYLKLSPDGEKATAAGKALEELH